MLAGEQAGEKLPSVSWGTLGAGHASKIVTGIANPLEPMIQAKSPTARSGPAERGWMRVSVTGGVVTCTKATSRGSAPLGSVMPGESDSDERGGVEGSPMGKQPMARASLAGSGGLSDSSGVCPEP